MAPYTVVAFFTFSNADTKATFMAEITKLAAWVKENEPDTTAYAFYDDKDDPLVTLGFEQFSSEEAFKNHCATEQTAAFLKLLVPLMESGDLKIDQKFGHSELSAGYLTRT